MPDGPPGTLAYWALLGPEVTLRRSAYDLERAAAVGSRSPGGPRPILTWPRSSPVTCMSGRRLLRDVPRRPCPLTLGRSGVRVVAAMGTSG